MPKASQSPKPKAQSPKPMVKIRSYRTLENALRRMGFVYVAGVDEVGRGCLAGPVVASAVVLHPDRYIPRICDSKTVTAPERDRLYERITTEAICWAVVGVDPGLIGRYVPAIDPALP